MQILHRFGPGTSALARALNPELDIGWTLPDRCFSNILKLPIFPIDNGTVALPYKGMAAAMADIATGKVHIAFASIPAALPFITSGDVRALATTGAQRSAAFPDLPTMSESGLPGYAVELWTAIFAPAGVPREVVARLNAEIKKALDHPDTKAAFAKVGNESRGTTPEDGAAFVRAEYEKWRKVITDANIK